MDSSMDKIQETQIHTGEVGERSRRPRHGPAASASRWSSRQAQASSGSPCRQTLRGCVRRRPVECAGWPVHADRVACPQTWSESPIAVIVSGASWPFSL
jgi:hypothetical protein